MWGLDRIDQPIPGSVLERLSVELDAAIFSLLPGVHCESVAIVRLVAEAQSVFGKRVYGFTMYDWVENTSLLGQVRATRAAQRHLADDLRTEIREKVPLAEFERALSLARSGNRRKDPLGLRAGALTGPIRFDQIAAPRALDHRLPIGRWVRPQSRTARSGKLGQARTGDLAEPAGELLALGGIERAGEAGAAPPRLAKSVPTCQARQQLAWWLS